jgi:transcriptional regulator with XRE-family HTH domain
MSRSGFDKRFPSRSSHIAKALAQNVRRYRRDKGWTQGDLAAKLDIEQMAVSLIENCRANPTLETLEAMAACFGVRFADLFESRGTK